MRPHLLNPLLTLLFTPLFLLPLAARAQSYRAHDEGRSRRGRFMDESRIGEPDKNEVITVGSKPKLDLDVNAYADLQFAYFNYGENQNRANGAQKDSRLVFDTTRLVLELEAGLPEYGIEAEFEVEFEHGGTGVSMELEYEEFGEFDTEVEKGGEALVEELYLTKKLGHQLELSVGRFYVAVGTLFADYRPTDYLGTIRAEAETRLIPNTWNDMGMQLRWDSPWGVRLTGQVVNGLDSTAFNSNQWVARGLQKRFELVRASDLAAVLRADVKRFPGFVFGVSAYYGGTTRNRPKPDLVKQCDDANPNVVAPCGYVSAPLFVTDAHLSVDRGGWRAHAMVMYGHLGNAAAVSARNARLSNLLNVLRTPVSDNALSAWGELGYDIAPALGLDGNHRLEPYVRIDYMDSQFKPRAELFDNPRFERTVYTVGTSYTLAGLAVIKLDFGQRRMGSSAFRPENTLRMSTGFVY
ncbi:hypothetical protein [Corallococcus sp. CA053C]|uniref:hypothetical protein n=1 Tax=Corallococcus sp. CA053C TaxID=2316732 RepID=UPI001F3C92EA|nr:hypothetical protein [Corallococcus sp. CA053C]